MCYLVTYLPMAPIKHMQRRTPKSVAITLSSFLSNVLLFEGTFMAFIITCQLVGIIELDFHVGINSKVKNNVSKNSKTLVSCPVNITAPTMYSVLRRLHP
ncbi:hypothetical protein HanRHA438_Chr08g0327381 [Helianthus annuus]|nr:hypothetical protein HanRHA438_Chr08g0327381 [Helianthus annuus]